MCSFRSTQIDCLSQIVSARVVTRGSQLAQNRHRVSQLSDLMLALASLLFKHSSNCGQEHSGRRLLFRTMYATKYDATPLQLRAYRHGF